MDSNLCVESDMMNIDSDMANMESDQTNQPNIAADEKPMNEALKCPACKMNFKSRTKNDT